jgi:putative hydrolase of the HAD superfamily
MPTIHSGSTTLLPETEKSSASSLKLPPQHTTGRELLRMEIQNLPLYCYGIKGFMLSMIETALK